MDTILCATDLSPASEAVVAAAGALGRALRWPVELLHVLEIRPEVSADLLTEEVVEDLRVSAETAIEAQVAALRRAGVAVVATVRVGTANAIATHARDVGAALLVVGTHARKGAAHLLLGSVAERTLRGAPCPTLVVPPHAQGRLVRGAPPASESPAREPPAGEPPARLKVTVGIDFSPASDAALEWVRALRLRTDGAARLVHLFSPDREHERLGLEAPAPFEVSPDVVSVLSRDLRAHVRQHLGTDLPLRIRPSWGGEDDPLAWEAETDDADLLIIGTNQTRRSTALATVRGAHLPVLCVPEAGAGAGRAAAPAGPSPASTPVRTVLVATDFSAAGNAAVAEGCRLLLPAGGDLVLAHVVKPERAGLPLDRQEEIEACLLALLPEDLPPNTIRARTFVAADPSPGEAIVKAIRRFAPDVVVMSSQGEATARPIDRGATTEHVVWHSSKPVMVVPVSAGPR
jgi:nucleotide-binding universal stress UspA family protein